VAGHHDHHPVAAPASPRWLGGALGLILAFMYGEVIAGLTAHSLALISDAAHMLTDAAAVGLVLVTTRLSARPPRGGYTFGLKRTEILSAQANGITLALIGAWLAYAAIRRLIHPPPVHGGVVLGVALAGVAVNLAATLMIARAGGRDSLNVAGAFAHVLTDLYAFAATAIAGLIMLVWGFARADAIATLVVVALMARAAYTLLRASGRIFLEAAPAGLDPADVGAALAATPCVAEVHDLHIWEITSGQPAASAHVLVSRDRDCHLVRSDLESVLATRYGITHTTLQVDHAAASIHCDDSHGPSYRPTGTEGGRTR
jgi:cobalt-zinc-cadmium efflux system protein